MTITQFTTTTTSLDTTTTTHDARVLSSSQTRDSLLSSPSPAQTHTLASFFISHDEGDHDNIILSWTSDQDITFTILTAGLVLLFSCLLGNIIWHNEADNYAMSSFYTIKTVSLNFLPHSWSSTSLGHLCQHTQTSDISPTCPGVPGSDQTWEKTKSDSATKTQIISNI